MAHGVTPVAVAGAAADGADLERVVAAGTECMASPLSSFFARQADVRAAIEKLKAEKSAKAVDAKQSCA